MALRHALRHARWSTRALPSLSATLPHLKNMTPTCVALLDTTTATTATTATIHRPFHTTVVRHAKKGEGTSMVAVGGSVTPSSSGKVAHPRPIAGFSFGNWISDSAHILSPAVASRINAELEELKSETGAEFTVVLLEDMTANSTYHQFARTLFDDWGVGRAGINDGIMVVLYRQARKVEAVTGAGAMKHLSNSTLKRIQKEHMVPNFKSHDYEGGIEAGVKEMVRRYKASAKGPGASLEQLINGWATPLSDGTDGRGSASGSSSPTLPSPPTSATPAVGFGGGEGSGSPAVYGSNREGGGGNGEGGESGGSYQGVMAGGAIVGMMAIIAALERKKRQCGVCGKQMTTVAYLQHGQMRRKFGDQHYLSSEDKDAKALQALLTECNRTESQIGSMDYELVVCSKCHAKDEYKGKEWEGFEGRHGDSRALTKKVVTHYGSHTHESCRHCGCHSATHDVYYEAPATKYAEGSRQVRSSCKYCGKEASWTETIPKIQETSSSSSSTSSGGFGGGSSSGGGGASSSW
uniref:TPM domain-containing protein n=1 Tax=Florenciella parvula TaxID=236787 RepID=A0A7S2C862_9STRA